VVPNLTAARERLLAETHNAIVATLQPDGRPQSTTNWYLWDGARFWVSTLDRTVKVRDVRRNPRVTLCIDSGTGSGDYVQVFGRAELVEGEVRERTLALIRT
jgi:PPOX class probable F420-dependent enzyme